MPEVLIIYHSQTGNTKKMAESAAKGAESIAGANAILKEAQAASLEDLLSCDAVAFGSPENFGYMAGSLKDFFDRTFYPAQDKVTGKPYAVFINAGNDGEGALKSIERICIGYKFRKVTKPIIAMGRPDPEKIGQCRDLGKLLAGIVSLAND